MRGVTVRCLGLVPGCDADAHEVFEFLDDTTYMDVRVVCGVRVHRGPTVVYVKNARQGCIGGLCHTSVPR